MLHRAWDTPSVAQFQHHQHAERGTAAAAPAVPAHPAVWRACWLPGQRSTGVGVKELGWTGRIQRRSRAKKGEESQRPHLHPPQLQPG
jgi:hypothetical protein